MKRFFAIVFLCLWGFGIQAWSMDITALLDAAARQPGNEVNALAEKRSVLRVCPMDSPSTLKPGRESEIRPQHGLDQE